MKRFRIWAWLVAVALGAAGDADAFEIRIDNPVGSVRVRTVLFEQPRVRAEVPSRKATPDDVELRRGADFLEVKAKPSDGETLNLHIDAPFNAGVQIKTESGAITYEGYPASLEVSTVDGEIDITAPWEATRFLMLAGRKPKQVATPDGYKFRDRKSNRIEGMNWVMTGELDTEDVAFGNVQVQARRSPRLTLRHTPIPAGAPVKMPWQAKPIAEGLIKLRKDGGADPPDPRPSRPRAAGGSGDATDAEARLDEDGTPVFSSEVRMVNLTAAVYDKQGRPITGLGAEDFEVLEDGVPQEVETAAAGEEPFNLAILLDLSASTQRSREQMKQIARGFLGITQPEDRVAIHALANNWFLVLSNLTRDREMLKSQIERLPELTGASPIYDAIVLSYAEELDELPDQRNALIAITDGRDNRFDGVGLPSEVGFGDLRKAAEVMNCLIYPVYIGPSRDDALNRSYPAKAHDQLMEIAAASGGRIFHASTFEETGENVYAQVTRELRSVYSVAYYPKDQRFAGDFREVTVRVKRPGATVRAREGYVAR